MNILNVTPRVHLLILVAAQDLTSFRGIELAGQTCFEFLPRQNDVSVTAGRVQMAAGREGEGRFFRY
jgi:hypothetical protein